MKPRVNPWVEKKFLGNISTYWKTSNNILRKLMSRGWLQSIVVSKFGTYPIIFGSVHTFYALKILNLLDISIAKIQAVVLSPSMHSFHRFSLPFAKHARLMCSPRLRVLTSTRRAKMVLARAFVGHFCKRHKYQKVCYKIVLKKAQAFWAGKSEKYSNLQHTTHHKLWERKKGHKRRDMNKMTITLRSY